MRKSFVGLVLVTIFLLASRSATLMVLPDCALSTPSMTTSNGPAHSALTIESSPLGEVSETLQKEELDATLCDTGPAATPDPNTAMTPSTSGGLSKRTVFEMAAALCASTPRSLSD
ncbi:unnamed protein product [Mycena citricolor]|uniref:Secreted protein n=1 Tax=Mycena citricolor TaxID=2018698 RepID=A0AAD2Q7G1_9AGAR|nr:unnamed protein product [Mycena citricolor]